MPLIHQLYFTHAYIRLVDEETAAECQVDDSETDKSTRGLPYLL